MEEMNMNWDVFNWNLFVICATPVVLLLIWVCAQVCRQKIRLAHESKEKEQDFENKKAWETLIKGERAQAATAHWEAIDIYKRAIDSNYQDMKNGKDVDLNTIKLLHAICLCDRVDATPNNIASEMQYVEKLMELLKTLEEKENKNK